MSRSGCTRWTLLIGISWARITRAYEDKDQTLVAVLDMALGFNRRWREHPEWLWQETLGARFGLVMIGLEVWPETSIPPRSAFS